VAIAPRLLSVTGAIEITAALKRCLKTHGMTYAGLALQLKLSEASVKRLFASGSFTLRRIERICQALNIDLYELARLARGEGAVATTLTPTQEQALADNPRLLLAFHLLLSDWGVDDIVRDYTVTRAECAQLLLKLEQLELIELKARDQVRLRTSRHVSWRRDGPIRRAYQAKVLEEFLAAEFDTGAELLRFEARELSAASRAVIRRKLERLQQEFNELAEIDAGLSPSERESTGIFLAIRPYVLSVFTELKRRRAR
jgi:transcriptional regulator with XRE-family HTH domain